MTTIISLKDNFDWNNYVNDVYKKIININNKVIVIWDLTKLTKPPRKYFKKQILLMYKLRNKLWKNLIKSIVVVSNKECYEFLNLLFKYYTPERPVEIEFTENYTKE